jgi:putative transposase
VNGRKRHVLVDTGGLVLRVVVHPANVTDRDGARLLLADAPIRWPSLQRLWVDAGYTGRLLTWIREELGLRVDIVKRPSRWVRTPVDQEPDPLPVGFPVLPRRWVVERTFGWLGRSRRLSKDYEALPATEEAWVYLAMSRLMLARLAR